MLTVPLQLETLCCVLPLLATSAPPTRVHTTTLIPPSPPSPQVDHFLRFKTEERQLPVVWQQTLLCFVQR